MGLPHRYGGLMDKTANRPALGLIAFIVFIDMAGIGLIVPVMPRLVMNLSHEGLDRAAEIGGWLLFAYAIMQFFFSPVIGGLSDRFGRRPILLVTLTTLGIDYAVMAWAPTLAWLFLGRMISGIMGATWAAANSCVADIVPPDKRGAVYGVLGGAGAAGFVLGPALGGAFGLLGDRVPFIVASVLSLMGAAYGAYALKETLPVEKRRRFSLSRANPFGTMVQMSKTPLVLGCLITIFFMQFAAQANFAVWSYYGALKFDWGPLTIGATVALFGMLLAVIQGVLVGKVISRFGAVRTAVWSLIFAIPSYLVIGFATSSAMMITGLIIGAISGLTFPSMQSLMTVKIAEDSQGELQGAIGSVVSLTAILGPPTMTGVFGAYADKVGLFFPGAPYMLAATLMAIAVLTLWRTLNRHAD
ncbi:MFS transporter [Sphingorhabdus sp. IMCC26285]|uniref:MFS transporter n=2 Tax=Sphingorhabdus profundilacus TaxID=2509718 RepID=A0A6I4M7V2_9SPHN|nr:MFS transporter [Sphingorhabdus profundilacus]